MLLGWVNYIAILLTFSPLLYRKYNYNGVKGNFYDYHDVNVTAGTTIRGYTGDDDVYSTTAFTNRAIDVIDKHPINDPMFMYLAYQAPHTPLEVTMLLSTIQLFVICSLPHFGNQSYG